MSKLGRRRWCLVLLLAVLVAGCDFPGRPNVADRPVPADQIADFNVLYQTHCAACHGADGKLGPAPPLNDPLFLAIVPDAELLRVIREGRAVTSSQKTPMPAFSLSAGTSLSPAQAAVWAQVKEDTHAGITQQGPLTAAQVQVLAGGIKQRWGPPATPSASVPPYLAPLGSNSGKKDEGGRVFVRACADCHGMEGEGVESDGKIRRRINDPAFLALISDQELRRYAITGRPDLGMPPYDGTAGRGPDFRPLTAEEIDNLVAFLASWRRGTPAKTR